MRITFSQKLRFLVTAAYAVTIGALFVLGVKYLLPLVLPFIVSACLAAAVQKPAKALSGRLPEKGCRLALLTVLILIILSAAALVCLFLAGQLADFASYIPKIALSVSDSIINALESASKNAQGRTGELISRLLETLRRDISGGLASIAGWFSGPLAGLAGTLGSAAMQLPGLLIGVMVTVIGAYFMAADFEKVKQTILSVFPEKIRPTLRLAKFHAADTAARIVRTYAFFLLLTFSELAVGFAAIDLAGQSISYIIPLALTIALVDILPILGAGTVLLPWAAVDLISGRWQRALMLGLLYIVILLVRNFLEPKLIGQRFGLSPVATLAAIYIGGRLFGFAGVIIFPLTIILLKRLRDVESEERS